MSEGFMRIATVLLPVVALGIANMPGVVQQTTGTADDDQSVEVRLEPHKGRTRFTLGEPIRLDLVFTGRSADYLVNTMDYGETADKVEIRPAEGWYQWRYGSGHDYMTALNLDGRPLEVPILLNQGYVFERPGHYEVTVTTGRVRTSMERAATGQAGQLELKVLKTNTVGIDLVATDEAREATLVKQLSIAIADERGAARKEAAERLAYLGGDEAVREKVHWLLAADVDQNPLERSNVLIAMANGLASSRNLELQLSLLMAAWRDVGRVPSGQLESAIENTRKFEHRETLQSLPMRVAGPAAAPERETGPDLQGILASLLQRSGNNRAETAAFLMFSEIELSNADKARVQAEVLEHFDDLSNFTKTLLLQTHGKEIKDPSTAQSLRALLDAPDQKYINRDALEKLIEVSPETAGPFVVRGICEPDSDLPEKSAGGLPDETLPGVDACLTMVLKQWSGRSDLWFREKVLMGARYGSSELLPLIREMYTARAGKFPRQHDGPFLAYLLRYAPKDALPEIEMLTGSDRWIAFMDIDHVFAELNAQFPSELLTWLRTETKSTDKNGNEAAWAQKQLAQFGSDAERQQARQETTP
jgi:hypothetical protein